MAVALSPMPNMASMSMSMSIPSRLLTQPRPPAQPGPMLLVVSSSLGRDGRHDGSWSDEEAAGLLRGGFPPFREIPYTQLTPWAAQRPQVG